jgi:hypothetical protein
LNSLTTTGNIDRDKERDREFLSVRENKKEKEKKIIISFYIRNNSFLRKREFSFGKRTISSL